MTNKQKVAYSTVGMLTVIWGGAYIMHLVPGWATFPTWATGWMIFVGCVALMCSGIDGLTRGRK